MEKNKKKEIEEGKSIPSLEEITKMLQENGFKKENIDIWDIGYWELKISISSFDMIDIDKLIGSRKRVIKKKMAIVKHGILNDIKNKLNIELEKVIKEVYMNYS